MGRAELSNTPVPMVPMMPTIIETKCQGKWTQTVKTENYSFRSSSSSLLESSWRVSVTTVDSKRELDILDDEDTKTYHHRECCHKTRRRCADFYNRRIYTFRGTRSDF
jgi:hypothetical protein